MSSTRTAKDDSVYHQHRYASSPEFERGLIANLVAKRAAMLDDKADRELIWFVQYLSHQPGGLAAVSASLLKNFPYRLGAPAMLKRGNRKAQNYTSAEVVEIRKQMPRELRRRFPLRGETNREIAALALYAKIEAERASMIWNHGDGEDSEVIRACPKIIEEAKDAAIRVALDAENASKYPTSYPVQDFMDACRKAAITVDDQNGISPLERELCDLCLKPGRDLSGIAPWFFSDVVNVLREFHQQWAQDKAGVVVTTLGKRVGDTLDYCEDQRCLALLEGNARLGKSFAARAWCERHPGKARFVEVATGNDDASFFRAMARGLGLGNFLQYKVGEIRERVESVLRTGDLLLVLDEAQRLWPQRNLRYGFPGRVVWLMTMANAGVPICMVSTPQFIQTQKAMEKNGWNSAQFTGRIGHYEFLPTELTLADLKAVAREILPEANEDVLVALASYARISARYLAAVDSIANRARFIAKRDGRAECSSRDVRTAMQDSIIPSDTLLARKLEQAKSTSACRGALPACEPIAPAQTSIQTPARATRPAAEIGTDIPRRAGDIHELVKP